LLNGAEKLIWRDAGLGSPPPPPEPPHEPRRQRIHIDIEIVQKAPPKSSPGFWQMIGMAVIVAIVLGMIG
jgi:hypothetical protein